MDEVIQAPFLRNGLNASVNAASITEKAWSQHDLNSLRRKTKTFDFNNIDFIWELRVLHPTFIDSPATLRAVSIMVILQMAKEMKS